MTVAAWQPGVEYAPGAVVRANTVGSVTPSVLTNADFESGNSDWTVGSGASIVNSDAYVGSWALRFASATPGLPISTVSTNDDRHAIEPGQSVGASAVAKADERTMFVDLGVSFYNSGGTLISTTYGDRIGGSTNKFDFDFSDEVYRPISVRATAPEDAATCSVAIRTGTNGVIAPGALHVDSVVFDHIILSAAARLNFQATQAAAAYSGTSEPTWPTIVGNTVVDNEVTWEAVNANIVIWKARAVYKSGGSEPTWPTAVEGVVDDNTVRWVAGTLRVTDPNCPNTKEVAIISSKIFAADQDIVAYSATINPLDWTSANDAGYIPFGLNTYGANPVSALGIYRSNLVVFNDKAFQMWQVDEDPANMALLDAIPVGCPYYKSGQPVQNDFVFLTEAGIRSMGIAGASTNLQAGHFGKQIDPLILEAIASGDIPNALYYPGAGQYWLIFGAEAFVLTMNGGAKDISWSRYVFPSDIDDWTILGAALYLRSGDKVWKFDEDTLLDDAGGADVTFEGRLWFQYLDFGAIGVTKEMIGFDTVVDGEYSVSFGYNQNDDTQATTAYTVTDGDTVVGDIIPMPLSAPSIQMRLNFTGNAAWEWHASTLYLMDWRLTS